MMNRLFSKEQHYALLTKDTCFGFATVAATQISSALGINTASAIFELAAF
jgi:hypothetical protein